MRVFLAVLFAITFSVLGCDINNPIQPGPSGAPSRITLDTDEESEGDTATGGDLQLPARFENPLSSFDFNTLDGGRDLEPDGVLDPDGVETPSDDPDPDADDGDDGLEPEVIDDDDDDGDSPEPEVDDDDSDDDFGADEVVE